MGADRRARGGNAADLRRDARAGRRPLSGYEVVEAGHLGGYVRGGDPATFYPDLWAWLVEQLGVRSVLDVGCGEGHAVDYFAALGAYAVGVDGVPQAHPLVARHDYAEGPFDLARAEGLAVPRRRFDLVWSCEFVEHVEERYAPNFLASFRLGERVLMTHAEPGQGGYHHVNCRTADYWVGALAATGYALDEALTQETRGLASRNPSPWNHYARSGLVFRRS